MNEQMNEIQKVLEDSIRDIIEENVYIGSGTVLGATGAAKAVYNFCIPKRAARLAALQSTNEGQAETIRKLREALEVAERELNDANVGKFSFALQEVRTALLASTTPKDGQG